VIETNRGSFGGSGWTDDGTVVRLTTSTDDVGIGTSSPTTSPLHLVKQDASCSLGMNTYSDGTYASSTFYRAARGTVAIPTIVADADVIGDHTYSAYDGGAFRAAARIRGVVDGTPGSSDMPGALTFWTTPDGSVTPVSRMKIGNGGSVVLNDGGISTADVRIEGDTEPYLFFTDSSADAIGIGIADPARRLHVFKDESTSTALLVFHIANDSNSNGPGINFWRHRGTLTTKAVPQDGDILGALYFQAWDGNGATDFYDGAQIRGQVDGTVSSGSTPGKLMFLTAPSGSNSSLNRMTIDSTGTVVINEGGRSTADVRMEGDTDANLFFLDASADKIGIGDSTPDHKLDVAGNIGLDASGYVNWGDTDGTSGYGFRDNAGAMEFKNSGGSWTPFTGTAGADTQVQFNNAGVFGASADFTFNDTTDLLTLAGPLKADLFYNTSVVTFTNADTTPSVSGSNTFLTANAGATSITNFDDGNAGQWIYIVFGDANTTLVHDVTKINLTGDTNWTFAANDAVVLVKKGTVWHEVGRAGGGSGTVTGSGAANRMAYWTSASNLTSDAGLTYTASTDTLTTGGNYVAEGNIRLNSLSNASAPTVALAGAGAGNVDNGAHTYTVTFVTAVGETSGANTVAVTVVDKTVDGRVSITSIPTSSNALVTARNIYRSKAGTATPLYYLTQIGDNTTTTYTDNTADASLSSTTVPGTSNNTSSGWILNDTQKCFFVDNVNAYIGYDAGINNRGNYLTAIGNSAGKNHTSGNYDTYIGGSSGFAARTTGGSNTGVGVNSLYYEEGQVNTAVGSQALYGDDVFYGTNTYSDCIGYNTFSKARRINYSGAIGSRAAENYQVGTGFLFAGYFSDSFSYPSTGPTVALAGLGAGNLSNGKYYYKVSFVLDVGETQPCTQEPTVTVTDASTDGQVALSSIPTYTRGFSCTARKIYRTTAGGLTFKLLTTINDNTTTTYTDNTADGSLGATESNDSYGVALGPYAQVISGGHFVLGGVDATTKYWIGGMENTNPTAMTLGVCNRFGTNVTSSANLSVYASGGTGTGSGADIVFYTYPAGGSGSSFNTAREVLRFDTSADATIFNDTGADQDFRIEGDTNANLVFVDAGTDVVNIGTATSAGGKLNVEGNIYPSTDNTYYLGKNDDDTPYAWKGLILKDTTNGKYYRIETINGVITATDLTD